MRYKKKAVWIKMMFNFNSGDKSDLRWAKLGYSTVICSKNSPKEFYVIGSDECKTKGVHDVVIWQELLHVKDAGFTKEYQMKTWEIPAERRKPFACLGLKIESTRNQLPFVDLWRILMWANGQSEKMLLMHGVTIFSESGKGNNFLLSICDWPINFYPFSA